MARLGEFMRTHVSNCNFLDKPIGLSNELRLETCVHIGMQVPLKQLAKVLGRVRDLPHSLVPFLVEKWYKCQFHKPLNPKIGQPGVGISKPQPRQDLLDLAFSFESSDKSSYGGMRTLQQWFYRQPWGNLAENYRP